MHQQKMLRNQKGFTLVEVIAGLMIIGILSAIAVPRYSDLEANSRQRAIDSVISELNGRENFAWANQKITPTGYYDDNKVRDKIDYNLGSYYKWKAGDPKNNGGTLYFKEVTVSLIRTESTISQPAIWSR